MGMSDYREKTTCAVVCLVTLAALLTACSSRYRLDLNMTIGEESRKVKVEQTQYVMDADLGDPLADTRVRAGQGNVAVVTVGTRARRAEGDHLRFLSFDEYLRCQVYMQLPPMPRPDTIQLPDNSFVYLLGRYEWPVQEKVFMPVSGFLVVDSAFSDRVFISLDGEYHNPSGATLAFDGRMKIKVGD